MGSSVTAGSTSMARAAAWHGILWKLLACLLFALINVMIRGMGSAVHSPYIPRIPLSPSQLAFVQNCFGTVLLLPFVLPRQGRAAFRTRFPLRHGLRVILAVLGLVTWYASLRYMSVNFAVTLSFLGPIFTVMASRIFLHEALSRRRIIAVACSLAGAFVLTRPDQAIIQGKGLIFDLGWAVALPMISALAWAGHKILSSRLAKDGESASQMTLFLLLLMAPVTLVPALFDWQPVEAGYVLGLIAIAVLAIGAHLSMAKSFAYADITYLTPFGFSRLFFSAVLSYCLFAEVPGGEDFILGASLIMISLLVLARDPAVNQV